ncbi:MAG: hypothetical protein ABI168_00995 [Ginsengibacter sp.]
MKLILIAFFITLSAGSLAQVDYSIEMGNYNIDSLENNLGAHKSFLPEIKTPALIALSWYPELKDDEIVFKYKNINSTARTTMTFFSIFKNNNKKFIIYINRDSTRNGIALEDISVSAMVGLIGHELAHVEIFKQKKFFGLLFWGFKYLFQKQQKQLEIDTDKLTIQKGLGWPLYAWADFVLNHSNAKDSYIKMKTNKYLSPSQILEIIDQK